MNREPLNYSDPAFAEVMGKLVPGTELTVLEAYELGLSLMNWVNVTVTLGHESPSGPLTYIPMGSAGRTGEIVRDFVAWTAHQTVKAPGCDARLRGLVKDAEWASLEVSG